MFSYTVCIMFAQLIALHENAKKWEYGTRVWEVEMGAFTPLVMSTSGRLARESTVFYKQLAAYLADKRGVSYSLVMTWLRCRTTFALLRSAIRALQGSWSCTPAPQMSPVDFPLVPRDGVTHWLTYFQCISITINHVLLWYSFPHHLYLKSLLFFTGSAHVCLMYDCQIILYWLDCEKIFMWTSMISSVRKCSCVITLRKCARGKVIGSVVVVVVVVMDTNFGISQHQGTCATCNRHVGVATGGKLAPAPSNWLNTTGVCNICRLSDAFCGPPFLPGM